MLPYFFIESPYINIIISAALLIRFHILYFAKVGCSLCIVWHAVSTTARKMRTITEAKVNKKYEEVAQTGYEAQLYGRE